jgi:hypothetical protein
MKLAPCAALLAFTLACQSGAPGHPTPRRAQVTLHSLVDAAVQPTLRAAVRALGNEGLTLRQADEDAGVVETEYFDLATVDPHSESYPDEQRTVRLRITVAADTLGRGSVVDLVALYQPFQIGLGGRNNERPVPRDHPAVQYARKVMEEIAKIALGTT